MWQGRKCLILLGYIKGKLKGTVKWYMPTPRSARHLPGSVTATQSCKEQTGVAQVLPGWTLLLSRARFAKPISEESRSTKCLRDG